MTESEPIRVLVVDDQDLVRSGFRMILSTYEGIEIVGEARNGSQAVEEAQRLRPDVVLMDIRMPEMTGYEAARAIRALVREDADIPIIAMTANAFSEDVKDAMDAGMDEHVAKPIDMDRLKAVIKQIIKRKAV